MWMPWIRFQRLSCILAWPYKTVASLFQWSKDPFQQYFWPNKEKFIKDQVASCSSSDHYCYSIIITKRLLWSLALQLERWHQMIIIKKVHTQLVNNTLLGVILMKNLQDLDFTLPNKHTCAITVFWGKNLDQGFVIIFDQWKLFLLIYLIPFFTSYRGPGFKSINRNNFHWSKIIIKPWSRFFFSKFGNRSRTFFW